MQNTCGYIRKATRTACGKPAGWGTSHLGTGTCITHRGNYTQTVNHLIEVKAQHSLRALGEPIAVNPVQALLNLVSEAAGNVAYYRAKVAALGDDLTVAHRIQTEEAKTIVRLYNEERDRLAKYSKLCIDVGISERAIRIEEKQAENMTVIIRTLIRKLDLGDDREIVALGIVREEVMRLASADIIDMPALSVTQRNNIKRRV